MTIELPKPIAVTPVPNVRYREFTKCGQKPLAGGQIWTYEANSTTPKITYQDPYGMTPNTNPIILDAAGEADVYLNGTYRFVVKDKNGVIQKDVSKIGSWYSGDLDDQLESVNDLLESSAQTLMQPLQEAISAALAAGAGAEGWNSSIIADGDENQRFINDKTVQFVPTITDLISLRIRKDGMQVNVGGLQGGHFTYVNSRRNENDGISVYNGWVRSIAEYVTPLMAGAKANEDYDDSFSLNLALKYAREHNLKCNGLGKTYHCHSVEIDNNQAFYSANLVCNKFDQDLISVLECSSYNTDPRWLKNIYFENIHIDGKRALHTKIKDTTNQEDGGRSGFRFIRPVDGLKMVGCSGINCASEGIILFPHGDRSSVNDTVKNVELINCTFTGNRRHGGSSNSVNGMKLSGCVIKGNGLDIDPSAPINSGLRGDTVGGGLYGSAWDCEEYSPDVQSTNMFFNDCTMTGNAKSGLLVLTYGSPSGTNKAVIEINGGSYDRGISTSRDIYSILITPVTNMNFPSTKLLKVEGVNLNGGDLGGRGIDNFIVINPVNVGTVRALELTTMYTTGDFAVSAEASTSYVRKVFSPEVRSFKYSNNLLELNTTDNNMELRGGIKDTGGSSFKLSAFRGVERGSIEFKMNAGTGSTDLYFSYLGVNKLCFKDNAMLALASYSLGFPGYSVENIYLTNSPVITSDENQKTLITDLSQVELQVASELKTLIKKYKMRNAVEKKGDADARWHVGVIAQEVEGAFGKYGLNAFEYGLLCKDETEGNCHYAVRYDELITFILTAT